ncbi:MAG TPA: sigma 54-interacting transcriptional regulator [Syntrophobacteraceae bacterium]|nr:sigma 54-interacting transcriptional regulator [Syntrophobacteraceae bacterium]
MAERALDRYWKAVVSTIRDGIIIVNPQGTIISVNKALENMTGYSREELIGKKCSIMECSLFEKAREQRGEHWCVLFNSGDLTSRKCTLLRKDRTILHALKSASLLHDDHGKVIGAVETITDITELIEKDIQIAAFRRELQSEDGFQGLIGTSAPMQRVFDLIANAAQSDAPVIIFGESGTGKELVSKAIHNLSARSQKPFIKVNCAALTESLLESELFGHVKGAYTGAYRSRAGRFEAAQGGDIFLDEIGDLPLSTQVKLLRVLEEKVVERVGDNRPIPIEVRIITATNKNLLQLVEKGLFREDFYFRINVIPIHLPPLRERVEDIPLIAESFFRKIRLKSDKRAEGISADTMEVLMNYPWPGNIRELKSAFEFAFVTCQERLIQPWHLPQNISKYRGQAGRSGPKVLDSRMDMEKRRLLAALSQAGGNQSEAARILGVSRVTVWNRMKRLGIAKGKIFNTGST